MSPLRRFWLSWGGWNSGLLIMAVIHLILAGVILGGVRSNPAIWGGVANHLFLEQPPTWFLVLPCLLGFNLRRLLNSENLILADRHTRWQVRVCLLGLLPAVAAAITTFLILLGGAPLSALSAAACITALGAWLGFGSLWALPGFIGYTVSFQHLSPPAGLRDLVLGLHLLLAFAGGVLAWRLLHRCHWRDLRRQLPRILERLNAWMDHLMPARWPARMPTEPGLPGLQTILRLARSSLAHAGRLHLSILLLSIAGWYLLGRFPLAHDANARLLLPYVSTGMFVIIGVAMWAMPHTNMARSNHGLLAVERLWPMSRRRSAATTLLGFIVGGLTSTGALVGGMILGLLAADLSRGVWLASPGVWPLAPFAVAIATAASAAMLLCMTIPIVLSIVGVCLSFLGFLFVPPLLFPDYFSTRAVPPTLPLVLLGLAGGAALLLTPLAWHRLAKAELP